MLVYILITYILCRLGSPIWVIALAAAGLGYKLFEIIAELIDYYGGGYDDF